MPEETSSGDLRETSWWNRLKKNFMGKKPASPQTSPPIERKLSAEETLSETVDLLKQLYRKNGLPEEEITTFRVDGPLPPRTGLEVGFKRLFHGSGAYSASLENIIREGFRTGLTIKEDHPYAFVTNDLASACAPRYARQANGRVGTVFEFHLPEKDLMPSFIGTPKGIFYGLQASSTVVKEKWSTSDEGRGRGVLDPTCLKDLYLIVYPDDSSKPATAVRVNKDGEFLITVVKRLVEKGFIK